MASSSSSDSVIQEVDDEDFFDSDNSNNNDNYAGIDNGVFDKDEKLSMSLSSSSHSSSISSSSSDESSCTSTASTASVYYNPYDEDDDVEPPEGDEAMADASPPPLHLVEARLLQLMMQHSIPLGSYKSFLEWSQLAMNTNYDFSYSKKTFGANIKKLLRHESQLRNIPREFSVPGCGALPTAYGYVFPFLDNARHIYAQPDLMADSLWKYNSTSEFYSESNTGNWWKVAEDNMNRRLIEMDVPNRHLHYLAPVSMFIDNTHCDRNGRLQAKPCLASFGNVCLEQRKKSSAYFFLGLLPSKLLSSKEREKLKTGNGLRNDYLNMYHDALRAILKELHDLQIHDRATGGGAPMYVHGKGWVFLHFELNLIIGDTVGQDVLTGHNQCYAKETPRPIRSCTVQWTHLDNHNSECECTDPKATYDRIQKCMDKILLKQRVGKYREIARSLSHLLVIPALYEMGYGGVPRGLFCACTFEILHTLMLGTMKYSLSSLFNYVIVTETERTSASNGRVHRQKNVRKPLMLDEIERRIRVLSIHSKRQSDRDMPRASFNKGVAKLSGIQGQEYVGLSLLTIAALPGMLKDINLENKQFMMLLWKGISLCTSLSRDEIPKEELVSRLLMDKIRNYNALFSLVCHDSRLHESPTVVCKLPKLHGLLHFPLQIQDHGSPENFNGSYLESMLKDFIKRPGRRTRKTHADFALDLVNRWSEYSSITDYMATTDQTEMDNADMSPQSRNVPVHVVDDTDSNTKMIRHAFSFSKLGGIWNTVHGKEHTVGVIHPYCELLPCQLRALKSFLTTDMNQLGVNHVDCYYEMKATTADGKQIFRCNPCYRSKPWFDFISVDYIDAMNVTSSCASMLLLWLTYDNTALHQKEVYALTHSLSNQNTPQWTYMNAWKGDRLYHEAKVVKYETSISGVAYVLPGVDPFLVNMADRSTKSKLILKNVLENKYFLSIPQRHDWANIGWDDMS